MLKYILMLLLAMTAAPPVSSAVPPAAPSAAPAARPAAPLSVATIVYATAAPSIVLIDLTDAKGAWAGKGSGFIVEVGGHKFIATAGHCLRDPLLTYTVILWDGTKLPVLRKAVSGDCDLALGDVDETKLSGCPPLALAEKNGYIGTDVFALGYPFIFRDLGETTGIVSQYQLFDNVRYMGISAVIWHGDSGGPIVNSSCEVLGIVDAMIPSENQSPFYLAVPVEDLKTRIVGLVAALK